MTSSSRFRTSNEARAQLAFVDIAFFSSPSPNFNTHTHTHTAQAASSIFCHQSRYQSDLSKSHLTEIRTQFASH